MIRKMMLPTLLLAGGCATTDPMSAGNMQYRLPRTDATPTLTLTLKDCATLAVDADLKVLPKAGAQNAVYEIKGADLAAARIKRTLKLSTNANGVLTGVNAGVSERSPQILGNYIKIAAKVLPFLLAGSPVAGEESPQCTEATRAAIQRAKVITAQMTALRQRLVANGTGEVPSAADRERMKDLADLATELGSLNSLLTIDVPGEIKLGDGPPSPETLSQIAAHFTAFDAGQTVEESQDFNVQLEQAPFQKWFGPDVDAKALARLFALQWRAQPVTRPRVGFSRSEVPAKSLRRCRLAIATPNPVEIQILVFGSGTQVRDVKKKITAYAAQWGAAGDLCIDAGFGESRTIELAFDDFGRTTSYAWSSEATEETISGAMAGAAEDAVAIGTALRGPGELASKKAEIDELETQQKLDKLRACQRILESGGQCPE